MLVTFKPKARGWPCWWQYHLNPTSCYPAFAANKFPPQFFSGLFESTVGWNGAFQKNEARLVINPWINLAIQVTSVLPKHQHAAFPQQLASLKRQCMVPAMQWTVWATSRTVLVIGWVRQVSHNTSQHTDLIFSTKTAPCAVLRDTSWTALKSSQKEPPLPHLRQKEQCQPRQDGCTTVRDRQSPIISQYTQETTLLLLRIYTSTRQRNIFIGQT